MSWPADARAQTLLDKENDLRSWFNLGRPDHERKPLVSHTEMMCCVVMGNGELCHAWGSHVHDGKRYCHHHKPSGSARG